MRLILSLLRCAGGSRQLSLRRKSAHIVIVINLVVVIAKGYLFSLVFIGGYTHLLERVSFFLSFGSEGS